MKNRSFTFTVLACVLALGLGACGQRMMPPEPAGKIQPATAY